MDTAHLSNLQASPWHKPLDRDQERSAKREAVLRAAGQIFVEKGFHKTSLHEVAERLLITKPTLYYYIKNKDEILYECLRAGLEELREGLASAKASGEPPLARLESAIRRYIEIITRDFGMCVIRVGEDPLPGELREPLRDLKADIDAELRSLISECIDAGSIAPCDAKMSAFAMAGSLNWIGRWYQPNGPYSPAQIADHFVPILLNGLARAHA